MSKNRKKSAITATLIVAMLLTAVMPTKAVKYASWIKDGETWSYLNEDGHAAVGWKKINDNWYYFNDKGEMAANEIIKTGDHQYFVGGSGVMQNNTWIELEGEKYFLKGTGNIAKNFIKDEMELDAEGKAKQLDQKKLVKDLSLVEGKEYEENLYLDITNLTGDELKDVTIGGSLIIIGDNKTGKEIKLNNVITESLDIQTRNLTLSLTGKTSIPLITCDESLKLTADNKFNGEIKNLELRSSVIEPMELNIPLEKLNVNTHATVIINSEINTVNIESQSEISINGHVNTMQVEENAADSTIDLLGKIENLLGNTRFVIKGDGTIEKIVANSNNINVHDNLKVKLVKVKDESIEIDVKIIRNSGGSSSSSSSESRGDLFSEIFNEYYSTTSAYKASAKGKKITLEFSNIENFSKYISDVLDEYNEDLDNIMKPLKQHSFTSFRVSNDEKEYISRISEVNSDTIGTMLNTLDLGDATFNSITKEQLDKLLLSVMHVNRPTEYTFTYKLNEGAMMESLSKIKSNDYFDIEPVGISSFSMQYKIGNSNTPLNKIPENTTGIMDALIDLYNKGFNHITIQKALSLNDIILHFDEEPTREELFKQLGDEISNGNLAKPDYYKIIISNGHVSNSYTVRLTSEFITVPVEPFDKSPLEDAEKDLSNSENTSTNENTSTDSDA